jgi:peptidoglycan/LPS O-acetylase OafA/YrhL
MLRPRFEALDGLRAIAVLLVLLTHLTPDRNANLGLQSLFFKVAEIGWSGVDLFFVLSGFLVTRILLSLPVALTSYVHFVWCRFLRLAPVYFLALLIVFVLVPKMTGAYAMPSLGFQSWFWFYLSNHFPAGYGPIDGYFSLGHFWSLAVEAQFYLLWPVVALTNWGRRNLLSICVVLLAAALLFRVVCLYYGNPWYTTYGYLPSRMDGLIVGATIARLIQLSPNGRSRWNRIAMVVSTGGALVLFIVAWTGTGGYVFSDTNANSVLVLRAIMPTCLALTFGGFVWLAASDHASTFWLRSTFYKPIARWSYSIYVVHYLYFPLLLAVAGPKILASLLGLTGNTSVFVFFVTVSALSIAVGSIVHRWIERPVLESRWYGKKS